MDKTLFHDISYGMYLVASASENEKAGCIINTFCQITSEDMIISVSINKNNYTNQVVKKSKRFALSVISEQTNPEVIKKFGFYSSKDINKFDGFSYEMVDNLPVIKENTIGYFICEVVNVVDAGTHDVVLAKVKNSERYNNNIPMTYAYYHKVIKGKAPKNAPTYVEEVVDNTDSKKYKCLLCGYVYDDAKESVKFEDLPDDWKCPLCGADKSMFEKI